MARRSLITASLPLAYRGSNRPLLRPHQVEDAMRNIALLAALALAAALPAAAEEHVGYNLERGEPARWSEPITTPQQRYENDAKEMRNALADALKECRQEPREERARCEREAREQQKRDLDAAREREQRDIESARAEAGYREGIRR